MRRIAIAAVIVAGLVGVGWVLWTTFAARTASTDVSTADVVRTIRSGDINVVLRAPGGVLRQGRNSLAIEFRSLKTGELVDAGNVRASGNMPMPGMVMSSGMQVQPAGTPGRYSGSADFGMAGAWQMTVDWDGPAGRGSVSFEGAVQ